VFLTFEGIEGCGKSTQARRLAGRLRSLSVPLVLTLEPGGTEAGRSIRQILLDSRNRDLSPLSELCLYEADRAQHVQQVIKPALEEGKWVISDRFFDATTVYQGYARRIDMDLIRTLNEKTSQGILPDLTFLLDCPVEIGLERALKRESARSGPFQLEQDRFEREEIVFHEAVRQGYLSLSKDERHRFRVLDATRLEDEIAALIFEYVRPFALKTDT